MENFYGESVVFASCELYETDDSEERSDICDYFRQLKNNFFDGKYDNLITRVLGILSIAAGITLILTVAALVPGIVLIAMGTAGFVAGFGENSPE